MDLSKTFDCLQHDRIIGKMHVYGFEIQALKLIHSYLSNRFQAVKVKDTYSSANKVKSGVPQGSLLGVILFNIQFNDIFDIKDEAELCNYADDNNLSAVGDSTIEAKNILKQQTTVLLEWLDQNHLIANPGKFHLMFLSTDKTDQMVNEQLSIDDKTLNSEPSVTLLGMDIDNLLTFNKHNAYLCKTAASQLNVLKRLSRSMGHNERKLIMQAFILSNFNYSALIWHFCSESNTAKIEKIQERALRLLTHVQVSVRCLFKDDQFSLLVWLLLSLLLLCFHIQKQLILQALAINSSVLIELYLGISNMHHLIVGQVGIKIITSITGGEKSNPL